MKNTSVAVFLTFFLISAAQPGFNFKKTGRYSVAPVNDHRNHRRSRGGGYVTSPGYSNGLGKLSDFSANANLSNLVLSQGTLSPVFDANIVSYSASVANSVTSITITPTAADAGAAIVNPGNLISINGTLFFSATDANGTELWKSDGTPAGTVMVKDIFPGTNSSSPADFVNLNGVLFFSADDGVYGKELWKSDGTANGTVMVKDGVPGSSAWGQFPDKPDTITPNSNHLRLLTVAGNNVFFLAVDHVNGTELWVSTGTEASTHAIDIYPGLTNNSNPANLTNVNGILYFSGQNANGVELWKSDGTDAGTVLVKDINPTGSSSPSNFVNVNGVLYFSADDGTTGRELWKSDGTANGTVPVANISSGAGSSNPDFLTNVNGTLFFAANAGVNDAELWKSDGTAAGTVKVKDIFIGTGSSHPRNLINLNGTLLFVAYDDPDGFELWKSDGSDAGTVLVKNINPGGLDSNPENLTVVGNVVLFSADDGTHGRELWQTDGTAGGTNLFQDFETGSGSSNPQNITGLNSNVALSATTTANGNRLWVYNSSTHQWQILGNSGGATITVNGTPVTSGGPSGPIALSVGSNIITTIVTAQDGTTTKTYTVNVTRAAAPSVTFSGKVFLQGPYNTGNGTMNNILNTSGILQANASAQPYNITGFDYAGTENVAGGFFAGHPAIVDWVLVELRDASTPASIVARRAAFLKQDGNLLETDGLNDHIIFPGISPGNYYVVIRHRNHLGIMSSVTIDFSSGTGGYDFTTAITNAYAGSVSNPPMATLATGVYGMYSGNANADLTTRKTGSATINDYSLLLSAVSGVASPGPTNVYRKEDFNMDGNIRKTGSASTNDYSKLLSILGAFNIITQPAF